MARKKGSKNGLVHGWGINDVDYNVYRYEKVNGKSKRVWTCPYYVKWVEMIKRCFCTKFQVRRPAYKGCTITEKWQRLTDFIKWVDSQPNRNWENCEPDKDILIEGNKHYSPETVVFVSRKVNTFILDCGKSRGECMIGVGDYSKHRKSTTYVAQCNNPFTGKSKTIGYYPTEIEAHLAWQAYKHELACQLAEEQTDPRVADALRQRYSPDKDWTKV